MFKAFLGILFFLLISSLIPFLGSYFPFISELDIRITLAGSLIISILLGIFLGSYIEKINTSVSNVCSSKQHLITSWGFIVIGAIAMVGAVCGFSYLPSDREGLGVLILFLLGIPLSLVFIASVLLFASGLRGLWKAKQAKRAESNIVQNSQQ